MLIFKAIDSLQKVRRYLIQSHINRIASNIKTINGAIELLREKRAEYEIRYEQAITKRAGME